jgi:hypothetical protein
LFVKDAHSPVLWIRLQLPHQFALYAWSKSFRLITLNRNEKGRFVAHLHSLHFPKLVG